MTCCDGFRVDTGMPRESNTDFITGHTCSTGASIVVGIAASLDVMLNALMPVLAGDAPIAPDEEVTTCTGVETPAGCCTVGADPLDAQPNASTEQRMARRIRSVCTGVADRQHIRPASTSVQSASLGCRRMSKAAG